MQKRCRAFSSEYQHEFTKKKIALRKPYRPILYWDVENYGKPKKIINNSKELIEKLNLDRLHTVNELDYQYTSEQGIDSEEPDLGNELIEYIKNLYLAPYVEVVAKIPYTSTRVFGYASPASLRSPFTDYQDTYGRTGGKVMLKNVKKMLVAKRRRIIRSKLEMNASLETPDNICKVLT